MRNARSVQLCLEVHEVTRPLFVDAETLYRVLPSAAAIDALDNAFADQTSSSPPRSKVPVSTGELMIMPSYDALAAGVKIASLCESNRGRGLPSINGVYILLSIETLAPVAIIDGAALTALRTAAVSGLATRYLARGDASNLMIFGTGVQAVAHLDAMLAVRDLDRVMVVGRSLEGLTRMVAAGRERGLDIEQASPGDVGQADLVCACTSSASPVFEGKHLSPGTHVNAVGSYKPNRRELDEETVVSGKVVVESREEALEEAGDLIIPLLEGHFTSHDIVADLGEVVSGVQVRDDDSTLTVFKSVGVAFEDLALAQAAWTNLFREGAEAS